MASLASSTLRGMPQPNWSVPLSAMLPDLSMTVSRVMPGSRSLSVMVISTGSVSSSGVWK